MANYRDELEAAHALVASLRHALDEAHEQLARTKRGGINVRDMDPAALVDAIPAAPERPAPPPPVQKRSGDEALAWMSEHFERFAAVWLEAHSAAACLLIDKRGEINPMETRGDGGDVRRLTGVLDFLTHLWRQVPFYDRERWPYVGNRVFHGSKDPPEQQLEALLQRLEAIYLEGWPTHR